MSLFRLAILSILLTGCVAENSRSIVKDDVLIPGPESPQWIFSLPDCLPSCTEDDKRELTERARIETVIVQAIDSATIEVEFSMYTFSRKPIYQALVRAAQRGVVIKGIVDRGQFRNILDACDPISGCQQADAPYNTDEYRNADIATRENLIAEDELFRQASNTEKLALLFLHTSSSVKPAPGSSRLVHNKFVLIDNLLLVNGSGNWSSTAVSINLENLGRLSSVDHPEIIASFVCAFDVFWTGDANRFQSALRTCESAAIRFSPAPRRGENPVAMIVDRITNSQATIDIAMHHLTHSDVYDSLESALIRGVIVRLLFDDDDCNRPIDPALQSLITASAQVRYMPSNCKLFQLSHNKYGIFDGQTVINGSGNWSLAGLTRNYENFITYATANDVSGFITFFNQAWQLATERPVCTCATVECAERYCLESLPF